MSKNVWKSRYFCGNEISPYGLKYGYLDYKTLAAAFDAVLANSIIENTDGEIGCWEPYNGDMWRYYNADGDEISREEYDQLSDSGEYVTEEEVDIYQEYIISARGAEILGSYTDEIVYYNDKLDLYVWCVTHWGTSWDYVLTNVKLELKEA